MVFKLFVSEVRSLSEVTVRRSNEFLSPLNLSLSIDWEYDSWEDIYDGNAIGVYEADSVFGGEIVIGFNLRNLYKAFNRMVKDYPFSDPYTMLDEMIETNVYHEMGHGIVQLFNDYLQESDDLDELYDNNREVFDSVLDNEEDAVERFAWSFYDNQLDESELYQIIRLYLYSYNLKTEGIDMSKRGKSIIRLTEGDLRSIVIGSVSRILSESDLTNNQIRNITGISDDDELNAACMAEDAEELESNIVRDLRDRYGFHNIYDKGVILDFSYVKGLLEQKYGMDYLGFNEDDYSHSFGNDDFIVVIWSRENYPNLAKFHLENMHVYNR